MEGEREDPVKCLELCSQGITLRRIKRGKASAPNRIYLRDQKWFCYHSSGFWDCVSSKLKSVEISDILEVRAGYSTDNLHLAAKNFAFRGKLHEENCFSIVFSHRRFLHKSVDFVADDAAEGKAFVTALRYLIEKHNKLRVNYDERAWLIDQFQKADTNHNGQLSFNEVWKLLKKLNLDIAEDYAKAMFKDADENKTDNGRRGDGALDENEFLKFFEKLTDRPEIVYALRLFSSTKDPALSLDDLKKFLRKEQSFDNVDDTIAQSVINKFEAPKPDGQKSIMLGPIGFKRLMQSEWGSILKPKHDTIFQDMNLPLNNYYVNSSHNTYLTGLQLKGEASVEGYIGALRKGARLLELDIFDGDHGEPCITHKRTLITAITLRNALKAIVEHAFTTSPYPVILTIENHVGLTQQRVMARIFKEILGDKIYMRPENGASQPLPSPNALKGKFLLRGKKLPMSNQDKQFDEDADELQVQKKHEKITLDPSYSELISLPSVKLSQNLYENIKDHPMDGSPSISETKVVDYLEGGSALAAYTAQRFVKAYPKGIRQDSSNMDPLPSWLCGIQSVAMNMQTSGEYLDLVYGLFRINGNCGYVLKPEILRNGIDPRQPQASDKPPMRLSVEIISGQYLPKPTPDNDVIDPYVTVEIFGIPEDCQKVRTKTIMNNGFNPQWNESFTMMLKCPQVALLRFCVKDFDSTSANDFVGEFTLPVPSVRSGYSHIRLNTGYGHTVDDSASLLVRISINED